LKIDCCSTLKQSSLIYLKKIVDTTKIITYNVYMDTRKNIKVTKELHKLLKLEACNRETSIEKMVEKVLSKLVKKTSKQ